jgi:hypothetical protein
MLVSLVSHLPTLLLGVGAAALAAIVLRGSPRLFAMAWIATICFVPWWVGLSSVVFLPAALLMSTAGVILLLPTVPARISFADVVGICFFVSCLLPLFVGGATTAAAFGLAFQWLPALLLGRLLPTKVDIRWLYGCIAMAFAVVSVLAILEFALSWNPFVHIPGASDSSFSTWAGLQRRGGIVRAEGAFGHSIALGSSVAMAIPLALASRFRSSLKAVLVVLMLACSVVTFSRIGMIGAVTGVALSVLFLREGLSRRARAAVAGTLVVLAFVVIPYVASVFESAGSEATNSAAYRGRLVSLIPDMAVVGFSPAAHRTPGGDLYMGNFRSIDSALILLGLTYGWLALLVVVVLLLSAIVAMVARSATAPTIAIVAQIPALATVALITQFSVFIWFVAGLALFAQAEFGHRSGDDQAVRTRRASHIYPNRPMIIRARGSSRSSSADGWQSN